MARKTQAQQLDEANEAQALQFFQETLGALPDPRRSQGIRYPLRTVVVTALMAMVCGCDDAEAMALWGQAHEGWLAGFLELPHGAPSQDVYLSVLAALDPDAFQSVFRSWVALLTLRLRPEKRHLAIDGKTSRRSLDKANNKSAVHTVSAWMSECGLVLGQVQRDETSNEITAIPELLRVLDLKGATVTVDAIGCQTEIAHTIVDGGGDYLLSVKGNQPTLKQDIEVLFQQADDDRVRSVEELPRPVMEVEDHLDKDHGRLETRTVSLVRDLSWLTTLDRWPGASFVVRVERHRTVLSTGTTSSETAYFIGSDPTVTAATAHHLIRRHWHIETQLHWVLDVAFREDDARHRARNTARNMATLRHFALNIVNQDTDRKVGISNSRKRASWDKNYLIKLLTCA